MADDFDSTIGESATGPKRARGDSGEMESRRTGKGPDRGREAPRQEEGGAGKGLRIKVTEISPGGAA